MKVKHKVILLTDLFGYTSTVHAVHYRVWNYMTSAQQTQEYAAVHAALHFSVLNPEIQKRDCKNSDHSYGGPDYVYRFKTIHQTLTNSVVAEFSYQF
jgi:hypothetical protein